jgi:hypothetical protein
MIQPSVSFLQRNLKTDYEFLSISFLQYKVIIHTSLLTRRTELVHNLHELRTFVANLGKIPYEKSKVLLR